MDWKIFLVESSSDDLRYETRNSFRGGTDALNEHLCVHRSPSREEVAKLPSPRPRRSEKSERRLPAI
ncbi:hypothetical protein IQ244_32060 [Nostoc sp. LEGE 06077]|uniref:hypothetical protein n=1 Tax=Nostoc sp. LEGE 06077 TaxID=915325 RepID=UPI001882EA6D|nr:hypothetical protein [Nostoc sp. LEGE 06077]MBE9211040.1 hypothetical protein [Nostoc sp. LEGE 06077]